jgi:toxin YoeB
MSYYIQFEKKALQDIKKITFSGRKSDVSKLDKILEELKQHPQKGTGNPEQLKHNLLGYWTGQTHTFLIKIHTYFSCLCCV